MLAANSFAQGVIDVHSHIITPEFVSSLESEGRLMDEGFPLPKYDVENHLKWMNESGVQTSVLTLAAPQPTSADVVRLTNSAAARIKNHVLNFARQCRKGEPHSHEDFANLFQENKEYQTLGRRLPSEG